MQSEYIQHQVLTRLTKPSVMLAGQCLFSNPGQLRSCWCWSGLSQPASRCAASLGPLAKNRPQHYSRNQHSSAAMHTCWDVKVRQQRLESFFGCLLGGIHNGLGRLLLGLRCCCCCWLLFGLCKRQHHTGRAYSKTQQRQDEGMPKSCVRCDGRVMLGPAAKPGMSGVAGMSDANERDSKTSAARRCLSCSWLLKKKTTYMLSRS